MSAGEGTPPPESQAVEGKAAQASGPPVQALKLEGVTVSRGGRPVVRDVSLTLPAGEVTALLGPNGAGKSSLVLAVSGTLRLDSGSVDLEGRELGGHRPEKIRG